MLMAIDRRAIITDGLRPLASYPTASDIADAVWDEPKAGHTVSGSFGEEVTKQGKKLDRNLVLDL